MICSIRIVVGDTRLNGHLTNRRDRRPDRKDLIRHRMAAARTDTERRTFFAGGFRRRTAVNARNCLPTDSTTAIRKDLFTRLSQQNQNVNNKNKAKCPHHSIIREIDLRP